MRTPYPELLTDRTAQHRAIILYTYMVRRSVAAYRADRRVAEGLCITCDNSLDGFHRNCSTCRSAKKAAA